MKHPPRFFTDGWFTSLRWTTMVSWFHQSVIGQLTRNFSLLIPGQIPNYHFLSKFKSQNKKSSQESYQKGEKTSQIYLNVWNSCQLQKIFEFKKIRKPPGFLTALNSWRQHPLDAHAAWWSESDGARDLLPQVVWLVEVSCIEMYIPHKPSLLTTRYHSSGLMIHVIFLFMQNIPIHLVLPFLGRVQIPSDFLSCFGNKIPSMNPTEHLWEIFLWSRLQWRSKKPMTSTPGEDLNLQRFQMPFTAIEKCVPKKNSRKKVQQLLKMNKFAS